MQPESKKDFFITYNKADLSWAEWIAWELEAAGYFVIIQAWDFRPGFNFVIGMQQALTRAQRIIAVLSPDYLTAEFTKPEWATAIGDDPGGVKGRLLPIRVRHCELEGMLRQIVYIDLMNVPESEALRTLLEGVKTDRAKPAAKPRFPGAPRQLVFPGDLPPIWNVPHQRNPEFLGREELLSELRASLTSGEPETRCQAICGEGAVGKTQVASEYTYRHAGNYGLVWWLRSEEPTTLAADYAGLYERLELIPRDMTEQGFKVAAVRRWLELNDGWLLIFDNAERVEDVSTYLPPGDKGHALITSRTFGWRGVAAERRLEPLSPEEAVDLLLKRTA